MSADMIVVYKAKGALINQIYLDSLVRDGYNAHVSVSNTESGSVNVQYTDPGETLSSSELQEIQESYEKDDVMFVFNRVLPHSDCMQPFTVLNRKHSDDVCVAAFLYGPFQEYRKKASKLTPAFYAFNEWVCPKIRLTAKAFNCTPQFSQVDYMMLRDALTNAVNHKEMRTFVEGEEGNGLILMLGNGSILTFEQDSHVFAWGWTTDPLDYSESGVYPDTGGEPEVLKETKETALEEKNNFPHRGTLLTAHGASLIEEDKTSSTKDTNSATNIVVDKIHNKYTVEIRLSDGLMRPSITASNKSRNYVKNTYKAICGTVPHNCMSEHPWVKPTKPEATRLLSVYDNEKPIKDFKDIGNAIKDKLKEKEETKIETKEVDTVEKETTEEIKETEKTDLHSKAEVEDDPKIATALPQHIQEVRGYLASEAVLAQVEQNGRIMADPANLQGNEKMLPTLCEQLDLSIEQTLQLPFEVVFVLTKMYPKVVAMLWNDTRWELFKRMQHSEKKALGLTKVEEARTKVLGGIKKKAS